MSLNNHIRPRVSILKCWIARTGSYDGLAGRLTATLADHRQRAKPPRTLAHLLVS